MKEKSENMATVYSSIPYSVIQDDIPDYLKNDYYNELGEILDYYDIYMNGAPFDPEGANGDYVPNNTRYKKIKDLIDKEARFLFAHTPDFYVNKNSAETDKEKDDATIINDFIGKVYAKNGMGDKLLRAAKDCFIGKRVACILNFNDETGISITFLKSYEFIYEKDSSENLTKLIAFYTILDSSDKKQKRIKKKSYEMRNGICYSHELIYDGLGNQLKEPVPDSATEFTYIPGAVIINDGLSNDGKGESEVDQLDDLETIFSKLANADIDSGRKSMNAVRYTVDASAESTANLSTAPGAFWDIKSNPITPDPKTAQVGMLEPSMNYSGPMKTTLDRINDQMHSQLDIPDINSEKLQGVITSGKALKALYWGLIVRCDEKMLVWEPALIHITQSILDGAIMYPDSAKFYTENSIPGTEFDIEVTNNYPLLEDDVEEKTIDLAEVQAQTMSRKAYMKKWRGLTDDEADEELHQILMEKQLFEDSMIPMERSSAEGEELQNEENTEQIKRLPEESAGEELNEANSI